MKLIYGECLAEMDKLIANGVKVDAIITDPPYGITACKWDTVIPFEAMWDRLNKLIKPNGAIVLFGSEPFSSALRMSNIKYFKYDWIWEKSNPGNIAQANKQPLKYHEIISVFYNKQPIYNKQLINRMESGTKTIKSCQNNGTSFLCTKSEHGTKSTVKYNSNRYDINKKNPSSVLKYKSERCLPRLHSTQKPVPLLECLVKTYTNENETVLDFTMGSGTTGVACQNTNRNFIGIELNENYYNIAKKRIESNEN